MDTWLVWMLLGSTIGGTVIGLLGWAKQQPPQPLDFRNLVITVGDSLIAGAIYAVYLAVRTDDFTKDIINAAIFGAGGDMLIKGVFGTIQAKSGGGNIKPLKPGK